MLEQMGKAAREASYKLAELSTEQKSGTADHRRSAGSGKR